MIELRRRYSAVCGGQPSRLPAGYQEVEYLESDGKQCIVTDIYPQLYDKSYAKVEPTVTVNEAFGRSIFSSVNTAPGYRYGIQTYANKALILCNQGWYFTTIPLLENVSYEITFEWGAINYKLIVNSEEAKITLSATHNIIEVPLGLFAGMSENGIDNEGFIGRMREYKHYRDGNLFAYLVPCYRKSDKAAGMYDIVNDVFYTNAGTGEFLVGQDVGVNAVLPSEYQLVDWLGNGEGTIRPCILTDIYPSQTLGFEIECAYPTAPHKSGVVCDNVIFGCDINWSERGYSLLFNNTYATSLGVVFHMYSSMTSDSSATKFYPNTNEFYKYKFLEGKCYINDEAVLINNYVSASAGDVPIAIFGLKRGSQILTDGKNVRIKGFRFFSGDETNTIAHFYPCYRKLDNVAGLYDIVRGQFYESENEGEFIVGADIIE